MQLIVSFLLISLLYGTQIVDLNTIASDFFHDYCKNVAHRDQSCLKWLDLTDGHDKNWPQRAIKVRSTENLVYKVRQKISKPSLTLSQDYCNTLNESGSFTFKKSKEVSSTCSWSVTTGLKITESITETVKIPELESTSFTETVEMDFSTTATSSTEHKDTWEVDSVVPVPPKTYVNATYVVVEDDFSADWTALITFQGCVNVWFKDKYDVNHDGDMHWEWWFWPYQVFGDQPGFKCGSDGPLNSSTLNPSDEYPPGVGLDACEKAWCKFTASGTYKGIGGAQAHLNTDHKPCKH